MENGTMIQFFHWYLPADGSLWKSLKAEAKHLADIGITAVWTPPASKGASGGESQGYDLYDMYDLGEFDQKGSIRTKFGTKDEYLAAIAAIHEAGMQVYVDVVTNHLSGADEAETIQVRKVDPENRTEYISEPYEIEAYTKFLFRGRKNKYSSFQWDFRCFTGVDFDKRNQETAIFTILNEYGDNWEDVADNEFGNYDYLMCADIEFRNPAVREEFKRWAEWYWQLIKFDGVRMDAVKHVTPSFIVEWLEHVNNTAGHPLFAVGEYWSPEKLHDMLAFLEMVEQKMSLFDACLQRRFFLASNAGDQYDLRTIFDETLVSTQPDLAVTLVGNHDTQPFQVLEAPVEPWFKPLAYSLILLRRDGYPCIFYPDLYGASYREKTGEGQDCEVSLEPVPQIDKLILARKKYAYGEQVDYFDFPTCIGWTRKGDEEHPGSGCAVVLSNGDRGNKTMDLGKHRAGKIFYDLLGNCSEKIKIGEDGFAEFHCEAGSVSVWVAEESKK